MEPFGRQLKEKCFKNQQFQLGTVQEDSIHKPNILLQNTKGATRKNDLILTEEIYIPEECYLTFLF